jgi:excisionase family DNA binding protein
MTPALAAHLVSLEQALAEVSPQEAMPLLAELVEKTVMARVSAGDVAPVIESVAVLLVKMLTKIMATVDNETQGGAEDLQLLSVPQVAALLALPKGRVYELIRQGQISAIRIGEKNVRVPRAGLREWVVGRPKRALDIGMRVTHSITHDGGGGAPDSKATGSHPGPARRTGRRHAQQRRALGAGRVRDSRIGRATPPGSREDRTDGEA